MKETTGIILNIALTILALAVATFAIYLIIGENARRKAVTAINNKIEQVKPDGSEPTPTPQNPA